MPRVICVKADGVFDRLWFTFKSYIKMGGTPLRLWRPGKLPSNSSVSVLGGHTKMYDQKIKKCGLSVKVVQCTVRLLIGLLAFTPGFARLPQALCDEVASEDLITKLKSDAPKQWEKYLVALGQTEGHIDRECEWVKNQDVRTEKHSYNVVYRYPWTAVDSDDVAVVYGKNYHFSLRGREGNWEITVLVKESSSNRIPQFPPVTEEPAADRSSLVISNQLGVGLQIVPNFIYIPSIWNQPEFEILSAVSKESDDGNLIDVEFRFHGEPGHPYTWIAPADKDFTVEGRLTLITDYYLVHNSEIDYETYDEDGKLHEHITWDVEYRTQKNGVPLPTFSKHTSQGDGLLFTMVKHFDLSQTKRAKASRFTLSQYGLPEPNFGEPQPTFLRYVLVFLGGALVLYALFDVYQKRRTNRNTQ
jgi:hypothetical protein